MESICFNFTYLGIFSSNTSPQIGLCRNMLSVHNVSVLHIMHWYYMVCFTHNPSRWLHYRDVIYMLSLLYVGWCLAGQMRRLSHLSGAGRSTTHRFWIGGFLFKFIPIYLWCKSRKQLACGRKNWEPLIEYRMRIVFSLELSQPGIVISIGILHFLCTSCGIEIECILSLWLSLLFQGFHLIC